VFVDIDPDTYNLDPSLVEAAVTRRTKAILPVHYAGQGCDMDAINRIAEKHRLYVIEDAAQGVGAYWDGQALGTIGDIGCYSFHATKNVTCGEGGAFLTNDNALARRAEVIREKGTNRAAFLRGEIDKYSWVDLGSSFVLSDVLAGFLRVQLERSGMLNALRLRLWRRYYDGTADLEAAGLVKRPTLHPKAAHNGHLFALLIENGRRDEIMDAMKSRGIRCNFHYVPLHSSPFMREYFGGNIPHLPVTDRVSNSLLRLPLFAHLTEDDVDYILDRLHEAFDGDGDPVAFGLRPMK
jgi:dTDP-4-amino-4,6-dideoxygalactose transaminase